MILLKAHCSAIYCFILAFCAMAVGEIPEGLTRLLAAYPDSLMQVKEANVLVWKDGTEMVYDDGLASKDYDTLLNRACLKDQMLMPYPVGWPPRLPEPNQDPGRIRCETFFKKMYGDSELNVREQLVPVTWLDRKSLYFNSKNGAATALERVSDAIRALPVETQAYVRRPVGTFYWRTIAGESRLSMHSFGIAIDFILPHRETRYWRDAMKGDTGMPQYPVAILKDERLGVIVSLFEQHGFIWGGKWHHYDTMHFEYRPELFNLIDSDKHTSAPSSNGHDGHKLEMGTVTNATQQIRAGSHD